MVPENKTICIITKTLFTLFTVLIFALMMQKQWWVKLLTQHKSRLWHQTTSDVILYCNALIKNKQKTLLVSLKSVFDETVKIIIKFIKSWPLNTCFLINLYDEMGSMHKVCCILKNNGCLKEKPLCNLVASWANHLFLCYFIFTWTTGRQAMVIYSWVFADIFSKIIKMILSLQEKRLMVFVANDKMICCQLKIQNLENLYFTTMSLTTSHYLKNFWWDQLWY